MITVLYFNLIISVDWLNDISLFKRLQAGDEEVLKSFFEDFYPVYVSFTFGYLNDKDECEDVVQDAFVQFWETRALFHSIYAARAFLYKTIRNKCLNIIRHRNIKIKHARSDAAKVPFDLEGGSFFIDSIIREETSRIIYEEVQGLSEMGKKVILLSMEGLSNEEIAERLGIAVNTVKTHKSRTYQQLRIRLNELKILLSFIV